ncbi:MAG: sigma factor [Syntrophomonadaceae bacterium]|nr:sigma factor [Syntrophomonadaceae bacterium]MDD3888970.1 sigma factor [Syntrophomonadaceae bacterium]MDD4549707.1 sigma factor [Syntrophomonadaceae bacterium]
MPVSAAKDLENRIYRAWEVYTDGDNSVIDDVYDIIFPFCLRVCSKTCGQFIDSGDEETSVARLALLEAFEGYNPERGRFLVYLAQVIKNRLIDYKRSEKKHFSIPLSFLQKGHEGASEYIDEDYIENIIDGLARQDEIVQLKNILREYDIEFSELVDSSPRQAKTRAKAREIAWSIANNDVTIDYFLKKKKLPVKMLENNFGFNRKLIDRYRKFIVTSTIIILSDFQCLKAYVIPEKREES